MSNLKKLLVILAVLIGAVGGRCQFSLAQAETPASELVIDGRSLGYWVSQANSPDGPTDVQRTVAALAAAVRRDDPSVKQTAADALARLGPEAKPALPALLEQFGHEFPWVRVSCQAAAGSVGKEAVPALIEVMENNSGGPRIRAVFVLGGIGPDARAAVPAMLRIMEEESPVMQRRIAGVLGQIDPARFAPATPQGKAQYEGVSTDSLEILETADWPRFHGPANDSLCREKNLLQSWPEGGPRLLWTAEGLGRGYSTISIADGKILTMGDRVEQGGADPAEAQFVIALDLQTRRELWATPVGPPHEDGGPRCTPTVDGDSVYAIGTDGALVCLDVETGALRWDASLTEDFDGAYMSIWKFSESPLIDGDRLICTPGGAEATMVALDKRTGAVLWKCALPELGEKGVDGAGYSSAVVAEICGIRQIVQMLGRGVIGVDAQTGRFLWGYNRIANSVANVTAPVVRGDYVFASTAYNTGSVLLRITRAGDELKAEEVYFLKSRDFQNHHGGVVLVGDYIYGGNGPNRGDPTCIEFGGGRIAWKGRAPARGSAAVLYADGHLIFRYDRGEVLLIEASPDAPRIKGRFQTPTGEGPGWAHPVIHQGKLYLRHDNVLWCYDLRA